MTGVHKEVELGSCWEEQLARNQPYTAISFLGNKLFSSGW